MIEALLACPRIAQIVIDTDSPTVRESARAFGARVRTIDRPEHLRAGTVPMNDVLLHDVTQEHADLYLQTHATNPLLTSTTIERALDAFLRSRTQFDSLFGVTRLQTRLWDAAGKPVNHDVRKLERTQDLPPIYEENSNLYLFTRNVLEARGNRIGERPLLFPIPKREAWDIDEEIDFIVGEYLARHLIPTRGR